MYFLGFEGWSNLLIMPELWSTVESECKCESERNILRASGHVAWSEVQWCLCGMTLSFVFLSLEKQHHAGARAECRSGRWLTTYCMKASLGWAAGCATWW